MQEALASRESSSPGSRMGKDGSSPASPRSISPDSAPGSPEWLPTSFQDAAAVQILADSRSVEGYSSTQPDSPTWSPPHPFAVPPDGSAADGEPDGALAVGVEPPEWDARTESVGLKAELAVPKDVAAAECSPVWIPGLLVSPSPRNPSSLCSQSQQSQQSQSLSQPFSFEPKSDVLHDYQLRQSRELPDALDKEELAKCLSQRDFVLEPSAAGTLREFLRSGGTPEEGIDHLASGFRNGPEMLRLLLDWVESTYSRFSGADGSTDSAGRREYGEYDTLHGLFGERSPDAVSKHRLKAEELIHSRLEHIVSDTFVQSLSEQRGRGEQYKGDGALWWIDELVQSPRWRTVLVRLAAQHASKQHILLAQAMDRLAAAGFASLIPRECAGSLGVGAFSSVLASCFAALVCADNAADVEDQLNRFVCCSTHNDATFIHSQLFLDAVAQRTASARGGGGGGGAGDVRAAGLIRRVGQEVHKAYREGDVGRGRGRLADAVFGVAPGVRPQSSKAAALEAVRAAIGEDRSTARMDAEFVSSVSRLIDELDDGGMCVDAVVRSLLDVCFSPRPTLETPVLRTAIELLFNLTCERRLGAARACCSESTGVLHFLPAWSGADDCSAGDGCTPEAEALEKLDVAADLCQRGEFLQRARSDRAFIWSLLVVPIVAEGVLHWLECLVRRSSGHIESEKHIVEILCMVAEQHARSSASVFRVLQVLLTACSQQESSGTTSAQRNGVLLLCRLCELGLWCPVTAWVAQVASKSMDLTLVRLFLETLLSKVDPPFSPEFLATVVPVLSVVPVYARALGPASRRFVAQCLEDQAMIRKLAPAVLRELEHPSWTQRLER